MRRLTEPIPELEERTMHFRKQLLLLILFLFAVMLLMAPGASAQEEPVNVAPYRDGAVYEATTDQEVHIFWVWLALNPGLVHVYLDASHESYMLEGPSTSLSISDKTAEQYWSPVLEAPPELLGWECPRPLAAGSIFDYNLGYLAPGEYTLTYVRTLDYPVNDGLHICTIDGQPLADPPSLLDAGTNVSTLTITVSEPD
jgi:hypothetical protein